MDNKKFTQEEILTATLLSDIVYLEKRRIYEIKDYLDEAIQKIPPIDKNTLIRFNLSKEDITDEYNLKRVIDHIFKENIDDLKETNLYKLLTKKIDYFYTIVLFLRVYVAF